GLSCWWGTRNVSRLFLRGLVVSGSGDCAVKIYLAGKIKEHCWRHSLVDGLIDAHWCDDQPFGFVDECPVLERAIFGEHDYVGPFFRPFGCHGEFHGKTSHGLLGVKYCEGMP